MADIKRKIPEEDLQHGLKARHMQMIAIGEPLGWGSSTAHQNPSNTPDRRCS